MIERPACAIVLPVVDGAPAADELAMLVAEVVAAAGYEPFPIADAPIGIDRAVGLELLALCRLAVVDERAFAHPGWAYALGLREGLRPGTLVVLADDAVEASPRGKARVTYRPVQGGRPADPEQLRSALLNALRSVGGASAAAVHELIRSESEADVPHAKTDSFRERASYDPAAKERLGNARRTGVEAVRAEHERLRPIGERGAGVAVDLLLSYRAVGAWQEMIALVDELSHPLRDLVLVREQLAFAMNRTGRRDKAEAMLEAVLAEGHGSAETLALLGRCRKDRWDEAGGGPENLRLLDGAIEAYLAGFEADWRDAYPGINAVTLMEIRDPPDARRHALIPVVQYAVERRIARTGGDYWDFASCVELAVLARDPEGARSALTRALAAMREGWEPETTARNLRLIREARERRRETDGFTAGIEAALTSGRDKHGQAKRTAGRASAG